jgi:MFS family permease
MDTQSSISQEIAAERTGSAPGDAGAGWRSFRRLWASTATSNVADGVLLAAAPLLAATLTRDPLLVSGLTVAQYLPWFLFTLASGAIVDRYDRRRLLILGNAARAGAVAALTLALATDLRHLALLYAAVFVMGIAETIVDNAALVVLPRLVERELLERANGRIFATQSVVNTFIGPPLGSALFAITATFAFLTGSVMFAVAAAGAALLPRRLAPELDDRAPASSMASDIREGWRHFWGHRLLRTVALQAAAINFFGTATGAVLVLLATGPLGLSESQYGMLLACSAAGGVIGGLAAERVIHRLGGGPVMVLACLIPAGEYALLAATDAPLMAAAAMFVGTLASTLSQVVVSTLRQAAVPDRLLGRVTSAYRLIVLGAVPLGAAAGGVSATVLGLRAPFWISAVGLAVAAAAFAPLVTTRAIAIAQSEGQ